MLYIDFEFTNNKDIDKIFLLCYRHNDGRCQSIDLRVNKDISWLVEKYKDDVWCAFYIQAELNCLITLGVDVAKLKWIDPYIESGMLFKTHEIINCKKFGLTSCLDFFGIDYKADKSGTLDIILDNDTYSEEQWDQIVHYCKEDVRVLRDLLMTIDILHQDIKDGTNDEDMIGRAEFVKYMVINDYTSKGMPINYYNMKLVEDNRDLIPNHIKDTVNQYYDSRYGIELYIKKKTKKGVVTSFSFNNLQFEILVRKKLRLEWTYTASGKVSTKLDYIKDKCKHNPQLRIIYDALKTIRDIQDSKAVAKAKATALKKRKVYETHFEQIKEGRYLHHTTDPLSQKTSRSSPKPKKGFILNCSPWIRNAYIKADEDNVIIEVDYSQQEIGIGAALSGDQNLLDAYFSEDLYMSLAIHANAAPKGATKDSHPLVRAMYKTIQLGLGYTMGVKSLGNKLYAETLNKDGSHFYTKEEAMVEASKVHAWHQKFFRIYWEWSRQSVHDIKRDGFIKTVDNWVYYYHKLISTDDKTKKKTKYLSKAAVQNVYCQANGATMLRIAYINAVKQGLEIICPLHDAIYIRSNKVNAEKDRLLLEKIMQDASMEVLPMLPAPLKVGANVYGLGKDYHDGRGDFIFNKISEIIPLQ